MENLFKEVLSLVEDNVKWLDEAARHFADRGVNGQKEEWDLLSAAYEERARMHETIKEKLRREGRLTA